jgi:hypothetical protein
VAAECGANIQIPVIGNNTHFQNGVTIANFGDGVTVNSVSVTGLTLATANVTIDCLAPVGPRNVTFVTGGEFALALNGFTISSDSAAISHVSPSTGMQGQNILVTLTGSGTHWVQSGTVVSFGSGINVGNVTVNQVAQTLTAAISIGPNTTPGAYSITTTTNGEVAGIANGFTATQAAAPTLLSVTPTTGVQGAPGLQVTVNTANTLFTTHPPTFNFGANISTSVNVTGDMQAIVTIGIDNTAVTGPRTVILSSNGTELSFVFTVLPSAAAISGPITPASGTLGNSYHVQVNGSGTHWVQGTTGASLINPLIPNPLSLTVNKVTINSPTLAFLDITIPSSSIYLGAYTLTMSTGGEIVSLPNAFTVSGCNPTMSLSPATGMLGTAPLVNFQAGCATFNASTFAAIDGEGVTISNANFVNGGSTGMATFTITAAAPVACHNVTVTTQTANGSQVVTSPFCVTSTSAVLTSISPYHGSPGQTLTGVTIAGENTHFSNLTTVTCGPNISVSAPSIVSATQLNVNIAIGAAATTEWRQCFVNTGSEMLTIGFLVDSAPPAAGGAGAAVDSLVSVVPSSGAQGQGPISVVITGVNTNFLPSPSTVPILGQGITVQSWTPAASPNSSTMGTAVIQIDPRTPVGPRNVEVITQLVLNCVSTFLY